MGLGMGMEWEWNGNGMELIRKGFVNVRNV
jgi:hypothetical protein